MAMNIDFPRMPSGIYLNGEELNAYDFGDWDDIPRYPDEFSMFLDGDEAEGWLLLPREFDMTWREIEETGRERRQPERERRAA